MSELDLSEFRVDGRKSPARKKTEWKWEPIKSAIKGQVLAFDQSLTAAGWFVVRCYPGQMLIPMQAGVIAPDAGVLTSHAATLMKGEYLFAAARSLIQQVQPDLILHESPPIGGGARFSKMMRPEASLVASMAIRNAAATEGVPVRMIDGRSAKKRLTGNANATKPQVGVVLKREFPVITTLKPNNENTRDALALVCLACEEED